jgi:hypothetical protein
MLPLVIIDITQAIIKVLATMSLDGYAFIVGGGLSFCLTFGLAIY